MSRSDCQTLQIDDAIVVNKKPEAFVLSEGETATTHYFLLPYLRGLGYDVTILDSRKAPTISSSARYRLVVISRYVTNKWLEALEQLKQKGSRIIYFMDDDLFDWRALKYLPLRYKVKILSGSLYYRSRLLKLCAQIWVSTDYLANKYASVQPLILQPMLSDHAQRSQKAILVCYHGTAAHGREIKWLLPIIEGVQARTDNVYFELSGNDAVYKQLKGFPRVSVLHPMSWSNYFSYTAIQQRHVGLAPLLPGAFNAARGPTKFFDYARMGAIGLYSKRAPYLGFINDGVDGILLDNDPELWFESLIALAQDETKRERMVLEIRRRIEDMLHSH
jgi:hypothetical protein